MRAMHQRTTSVTVYLWLRYNCSNLGMVTSSRSRSIASCATFFLVEGAPLCAYKQPVVRTVSTTRRWQELARIFMRSSERNDTVYKNKWQLTVSAWPDSGRFVGNPSFTRLGKSCPSSRHDRQGDRTLPETSFHV